MVSLPTFRMSFIVFLIAISYGPVKEICRLVSLMIRRPADLPSIKTFPSSSIGFQSEIRNCEDALIIAESSLALISCDPGRDLWNTVMGTFSEDKGQIPDGAIWAYWYKSPGQPDGKDEEKTALRKVKLQDFDTTGFHPLGIDYHAPSSRLFVVSHHYDGSRIEVFQLDAGQEGDDISNYPPNPVAKHLQTVISDTIPAPNAISAINDHELYVTNDHLFPRRYHPWLNAMETFMRFGGSIVYANLETNEVQKVSSLPFANGIVLLNDTKLVASSTSTATVRLYDVDEQDHRQPLRETHSIPVPFFPDNLSLDAENWLYIAGHPSMRALEQAVRSRLDCTGTKDVQCYKSMAPTWVSRWKEGEGLQDVYVTSSSFGTGCTAARDSKEKIGLLSGLYEGGILIWRE